MADPSLGPTARAKQLWSNKKMREQTTISLANSVKLLADLWQSAWAVGKGDSIAKSALVELSEADLENVYRNDKKFVPSMSLDRLAASDKYEPPGA